MTATDSQPLVGLPAGSAVTINGQSYAFGTLGVLTAPVRDGGVGSLWVGQRPLWVARTPNRFPSEFEALYADAGTPQQVVQQMQAVRPSVASARFSRWRGPGDTTLRVSGFSATGTPSCGSSGTLTLNTDTALVQSLASFAGGSPLAQVFPNLRINVRMADWAWMGARVTGLRAGGGVDATVAFWNCTVGASPLTNGAVFTGALPLLDAPGEYAVHAGQVYWAPPEGGEALFVPPPGATPFADATLVIDLQAQDRIELRDLWFDRTSGGAVWLANGDLTVRTSVFSRIGGVGIFVAPSTGAVSTAATIEGSTFLDVAENAIQAPLLPGAGGLFTSDGGLQAARRLHVQDSGFSGAGVYRTQLRDQDMNTTAHVLAQGTSDLLVERNGFARSAGPALSLSYLPAGAVLQDNTFGSFTTELNDLGAIYVNRFVGSPGQGPVIRRNVFFPGTAEILGGNPYAIAPAIYLDWWTSHVTVEGNRMACQTLFGCVYVHGGNFNTLSSNSAQSDTGPALLLSRLEAAREPWDAPSDAGMASNVFFANVWSTQSSSWGPIAYADFARTDAGGAQAEASSMGYFDCSEVFLNADDGGARFGTWAVGPVNTQSTSNVVSWGSAVRPGFGPARDGGTCQP